jgi:hypothetical protein
LALAGAGFGGAGLAVAGLTGNLPVSKQQELEQLKAMNAVPSPELEQQARDEQVAQWGTAALAVGAGTGLGLLVDRFAGSPEVVEKLAAASAGSGGVAGNGLPAPVGPAPVSPAGGSWVSSGRLATEEEAKRIVNVMTRHISSDPLTAHWDKNAIKHVAERIKSAGSAELGTALDFVDANWDGEMSSIEKIKAAGNSLINEAGPAMRQALVNSITPEIASARHEDDQMHEFFQDLRNGSVHSFGEGLLDQAFTNPSLSPAERRLAAAGRVLLVQHGLTDIPEEEVKRYLHALDDGDAGGYQDRFRGDLEHSGLDPLQFSVPDWALSYKGFSAEQKPYQTVDELLADEMYTDEYRREAGLAPMSVEERSELRSRFELRDKHRRLRLGL